MGKIINDIKCLIIQKAVYLKLYKGHKPNEWEPWKESKKTAAENGMIFHNDIRYGNNYPNSFFDIWYPDESGEKRPVIVYFHGGGFIFGDKTTGDPLSADNSGCKLMEMIKRGYILVNANYALAPEYRFPVQIKQVDELFRFLMDNQQNLGVDMNRVCLGGGSAGADMAMIYGTCVCNPLYAEKYNFEPVMTKDNLKVLAIDEAALDANSFNKNVFAMLGCATGSKNNDPNGDISILDAKKFIKDDFIPSWVNASNEGGDNGCFLTEARGIKQTLDKIGIPCEMVHFPGENLPHGYMDGLATDPFAREAFESMMSFIEKYI